ncbi:hypothetical protein SAMN05192558_105203 [Actinokineospora alba]|uniref:Uncharacterized protein n=1 Tax=Actinokineospora alba TaxID=504798 RepID=A0A1H0N642_9PSEU|nr:hypothetical protein [Actinokineospora alba]TDP68574.1 hypothetical protein C8E96_4139 [Actinokineospora alba]SDH82001.1 hypothetical protein SAMN05421871_102253 [Actinokineospora alba]SDO87830.1 hypothetical protein SAMN05192558_105203 [Actinokineospora alba]
MKHVVTIELREIKPKQLRKALAEHLRRQGVDARDIDAMGTRDLLGEVMHELTSQLAAIVEDTAELTVRG